MFDTPRNGTGRAPKFNSRSFILCGAPINSMDRAEKYEKGSGEPEQIRRTVPQTHPVAFAALEIERQAVGGR
jgi:hypothetical protein